MKSVRQKQDHMTTAIETEAVILSIYS